MRQASGRQNHAFLGLYHATAALVPVLDTRHPCFVGQQTHSSGIQPDGNTAIKYRLIQSRSQRVAEVKRRTPMCRHSLAHIPGHQAKRIRCGTQRLADTAQMRNVLAADHHPSEEHELFERGTQCSEMSAQYPAVNRYWLEHTPSIGGTG